MGDEGGGGEPSGTEIWVEDRYGKVIEEKTKADFAKVKSVECWDLTPMFSRVEELLGRKAAVFPGGRPRKGE